MASETPDAKTIEAFGTLLREGGGFVLKLDGGRRLRLELARMPVDLVAKRTRAIGTLAGDDVLLVEAIGPDR